MGDDVYYVYIVRCEDDSLYTGIATDVARRLREHLSQREPGAKYTRTRKIVALEMVWQTHGRSAASKLEYRIKCLSHEHKLALVERPAQADSIVPGAGALAESLGQRRAFRTVPRPTRVCWWCTAAGEQSVKPEEGSSAPPST